MLFSSKTNVLNIDLSALILRIIGGGFMITHGYPKLMKFLSEDPVQFMNPFGIGAAATLGLVVFAEFICSIFVLIGLATRWAIIPNLIAMFYAAFIVHISGGHPFGDTEPSLMYFGIFLAILLIGPGKFSIDRILSKEKSTI